MKLASPVSASTPDHFPGDDGKPSQDAVVFPSIPTPEDIAQGSLVADGATPAVPVLQPRYAHIDSLRALAALLVLWAHTAEVFAGLGENYRGVAGEAVRHVAGLWMNDAAHSFDFGRIGVVVFFAVSGFVVPASLKCGRADGLQRFVISRVFRLYPAFWLLVPLGALTFYWIWGVASQLGFRKHRRPTGVQRSDGVF